MIIVLKQGTTQDEIKTIVAKVEALGLKAMISQGIERTIIGVIGDEDAIRQAPLEAFPWVDKVMPVLAPYKLVSREFKKEDTIIDIKGVKIGGKKIVVMAGPCAIENYETLLETAKAVKKAGAAILRGGAFKPRTSPYSFQGLGEEGLKIMQAVAKETGLVTITEVMDTRDVELVCRYADIMQIGARNMQNFNLLKEVGIAKRPAMLKRGMMSTIKEWLMSAEYILSQGNFNVMLCERGIRTFEDFTRNTTDINAIPVAKLESHLPVIFDPSHATGKWNLVAPVSKAAIAAGADGLLIEAHPRPEEAVSDGVQSLRLENFNLLMQELKPIVKACNKEI